MCSCSLVLAAGRMSAGSYFLYVYTVIGTDESTRTLITDQWSVKLLRLQGQNMFHRLIKPRFTSISLRKKPKIAHISNVCLPCKKP